MLKLLKYLGGAKMKKYIFGVMLVVIGFIISAFCFIYAVMNPYVINGREGLMTSFEGTNTDNPFIIATIIMLIGLSICFYESYIRKE